MAQLPNPNAMDVVSETDHNDNNNGNLDGYETDDTEDTIDAENPGEYGEELLTAYYAEATTTPPPTNRYANANANTSGTPPTRLLTNNTQNPGQVYKRVIEQDGTIRIVPFTTDDYRSGEQPFDETGRAINRNELPRIAPRRLLFGEEKEGGTSKSKSRRRRRIKRRRTKKSLRKRKGSRKRKTGKRRKTRSKK
jgi:hypothetical protein